MSNDSRGRTSRMAPPSAPVGSSVALVVTAIALVLGFLILRQVNTDPGSTAPSGDESTSTNDCCGAWHRFCCGVRCACVQAFGVHAGCSRSISNAA